MSTVCDCMGVHILVVYENPLDLVDGISVGILPFVVV